MKRAIITILVVVMLLLQIVAVNALTSSEAKVDWIETKQISKEKQEIHRDAKIAFAANKSEDNRQAFIDTGKEVLHAALNEAEAWLVWKDLEAKENPEIPDELKNTISDDIEANLEKIDGLRTQVDDITTQLELGIVYLKMVGEYLELLSDVARDSGKILVYIGNTRLETVEDYESKLRIEAEKMNNNANIIEKLDLARDDLNEARSNIDNAESSYEQVVLPGTPLIKFSEGNNYLRIARTNLLSSHSNLNQAYNLMLRSE